MLPTARPAVLCQALPDGAVLLDPANEVYYGLNPVGARIWALLPPACGTLDELCAELAREHPEVPRDTLRQDVRELLDELAAAGLVTPPAVPADAR